MKKSIVEGIIRNNITLNESYYLLKIDLREKKDLIQALPGQFVQVQTSSSNTFLRRPISICDYDPITGVLDLLVQKVGKATSEWISLKKGNTINLVLPLGNGFTTKLDLVGKSPLLVGGGVGIAPLLLLAKVLKERGASPKILLGFRRKELIVLEEEFSQNGTLYISTEDGSQGEKGFVTDHSIWSQAHSYICTCGPLPMMQAVAKKAKQQGISCEVSLENKMACGIGACLCCVEETDKGNLCTCTEGPVFNTSRLLWE